ncbi:MAG: EamA family transporter, partial [Candidatus Marinimicrobia bacterium]|nr:EamA family transporter [Candidatus Neomarinimicrobiota bacterium]
QGALGKNKFPLVLIAGIFLALHFACFYSAVKMAPIANATLFATLAPVFTLIYERVFLKRKLSSGALIGLLLAIAGAVVVHGSSLQFDAAETKGNLMALISSVFMSVVLIMGERIRGNTGNILYTRWLYLFAAITLAIIGVFGGIDLTFSWPDSRWILALVVLPTLIGHNSMSYAVKYLRPTIVGSMPFGEPILATILAWVLFGEGIGWPIILGGSITLTGLVILTFYRK